MFLYSKCLFLLISCKENFLLLEYKLTLNKGVQVTLEQNGQRSKFLIHKNTSNVMMTCSHHLYGYNYLHKSIYTIKE